MNPEQQLAQLITNGYFLVDVSDLIADIEINKIEWYKCPEGVLKPADNDPIYLALSKLSDNIGSKFITPMFGNYKKGITGFWDRVDSYSVNWHNDLNEGSNLFALIYFDTMTPGLGGNIHVRNPQGEEFSHLPSRGDCLFVNQQKGFEHKVTQTRPYDVVRRIANLRYNVDLLG